MDYPTWYTVMSFVIPGALIIALVIVYLMEKHIPR